MHAQSPDSTVGLFYGVGSETWIDVSHPSEDATETHWISESGILDLFLIPGPTPENVFKQYGGLTGTTPLPAHWSLGYHQCRWNYVSSEDVRTVQKRFDEEDMPLDVLWLDIEYSQDHKYFIWDKKTFPDPIEMINDVAATGRKVSAPIFFSQRDAHLLIDGCDCRPAFKTYLGLSGVPTGVRARSADQEQGQPRIRRVVLVGE